MSDEYYGHDIWHRESKNKSKLLLAFTNGFADQLSFTNGFAKLNDQLSYDVLKGEELDNILGFVWCLYRAKLEIEGFKVPEGDIRIVSKYPLHVAAEFGNEGLLRVLLEKGFDINAVNAGNQTGLMLACKSVQYEMIGKLIELGAELNIIDKGKNSALNYLIMVYAFNVNDNELALKAIKYLINNGAKIGSNENVLVLISRGVGLDFLKQVEVKNK